MAKQMRECYQVPLIDFVRDFPECKDWEAFRQFDLTDERYIVRICPSMGIMEVGYPEDNNWHISSP